MKTKNNPYDRESQSIHLVKCPKCGKDSELLESFAYYLWEHIHKYQPGTKVVCSYCKEGELEV